MEKNKIFDEEFKQKVSDGCEKIKDTLSDALLTDEGKLDTEKIGNAARETAKNVEAGVKEGYQKFNDNFRKEDGSLDKEKLGEAANRTYRKAGRSLATGVSKLAAFLTEKFGVQGQDSEIVDTEIVPEAPVEVEVIVGAEPEEAAVTAGAEE